MEKTKINVFVTPHSHYDYLWCDAPDEMGGKNAKLIKEALLLMRKYPDYLYIIDSVMAVEYFKLHYPEMMDELKRRVAEKRIEIMGGMVVAPDTLLASGETLVRQFLYGTRYFKETFDVESKTGFLIDSFSITPQLPQILKKFGFKHFIFVRGAITRSLPQEFWWKGLDGSKIFTHWMRINYAYVLPPFTGTILAPVYPFSPIPFTLSLIPQTFKVYEILKTVFPPLKRIFQAIACIDKGIALLGSDMGGLNFTIKRRAMQAATNNVFILCGTDNLPPSSNIIDAVAHLQKTSKKYNAKLALPADFLRAVLSSRDKFGVVGPCEMSGFMDKFTGTFSTRMSVKQAVRSLENQFYVTEAISTLASVYANFEYPAREIKAAIWRLLRCCFHDALPGCHVDTADDHIMKQMRLSSMQLARILKSATDCLSRGICAPDPDDKSISLMVVNCVSMNRTEQATVTVPDWISNFVVVDKEGKEVPLQKNLLSSRDGEYIIRCDDVPSIGCKFYSIKKRDESRSKLDSPVAAHSNNVATRGDLVEVTGKRFTLSFNKGKLLAIKDRDGTVLLEARKHCINDLRIFNDRGDSYLSGHMPKKTFTTFGIELDILENGPARIVIRVKAKLKCNKKWFSKPVNEITQFILLYQDDRPRIDFITRIENNTRNIRIQACFPLGMKHPIFRTEVPYGHIERDITPVKGRSWGTFNKRFGFYDRIFPAINWLDASSPVEKKGMAILNQGIPEQEIGKDKDLVFITLLRSTGYIGTLLPAHVPLVLGPFYSIPKAYELGSHECRYSLFFHEGDVAAARLSSAAMAFNTPLVTQTLERQESRAPIPGGFLRLEPATFLIKALKRSETNPAEIIIRVLETANQYVKGRITVEIPIKKARLLTLAEAPIQDLAIERGNAF
nr:glycoside hydrolase family 38 C-terminal domain-containing protein [Candidatus Sigynarchaeota archaeon]